MPALNVQAAVAAEDAAVASTTVADAAAADAAAAKVAVEASAAVTALASSPKLAISCTSVLAANPLQKAPSWSMPTTHCHCLPAMIVVGRTIARLPQTQKHNTVSKLANASNRTACFQRL